VTQVMSMLRPVGLPDPILNLRLTIILILRHLPVAFGAPDGRELFVQSQSLEERLCHRLVFDARLP
jgi:hypothetical protein